MFDAQPSAWHATFSTPKRGEHRKRPSPETVWGRISSVKEVGGRASSKSKDDMGKNGSLKKSRGVSVPLLRSRGDTSTAITREKMSRNGERRWGIQSRAVEKRRGITLWVANSLLS